MTSLSKHFIFPFLLGPQHRVGISAPFFVFLVSRLICKISAHAYCEIQESKMAEKIDSIIADLNSFSKELNQFEYS